MRVLGFKKNNEWIADSNYPLSNNTLFVSDSDYEKPVFNKDYTAIGLVLPGDEPRGGGIIYGAIERSGRNGIPVYIKTQPDPLADPLTDRVTKLEQALVSVTAQSAEALAALQTVCEQLARRVAEQGKGDRRDMFAAAALTGMIAGGEFLSPEGLWTSNGAIPMADGAFILANAMINY